MTTTTTGTPFVPRLSRAVALTVTADILATVGWFFAKMIATQALEPKTTVSLSRGSPFVVMIFPLISGD